MRLIARLLLWIATGIAAGCAYYLSQRNGLSLLESAGVAGVIGAILLSLTACWIAASGIRRLRRELAAYSAYEEEVVRQLDQVRATHSKFEELESLAERVANLEAAQIGLLAENAPLGSDTHTADTGADSSLTEAAEDRSGNLDGKVVRLLTGSREKTEKVLESKSHGEGRRQKQRLVSQALEGGDIRIRLQPVVDLVSRHIKAVEASVWLGIDAAEALAAEDVKTLLDDRQKAQLDRRATGELSRVVRMMDEDGQLVPVLYRFLLPGGSAENGNGGKDDWDAITTRLSGDSKLSNHLIAIVDAGALSRIDDARLLRLIELKNHQVRLALAGIRRLADIKQHADKTSFDYCIASVEALLSYLPGSNRRYGEEMLPALTRLGMELFATGLSHRHQASGLLDLDITTASGELISKPRNIRLYGQERTAGLPEENSG